MKFSSPSTLLLLGCSQALAVGALGRPRATNSTAPPYRESLLSLHKSLVEISSISNNETQVGQFLIDYLAERGFATLQDFLPASNGSTAPERFNVVAWPDASGTGAPPAPKVLVTSHIDTVPPYIGYSTTGPDPPTAETVIAGRGTVDAKGSVAAQIAAVLELLATGDVSADGGDDVMLLFVVGEEVSGDGMKHFSDTRASLDPPPAFRAAIFGEPTEGALACGHKGALACTVTAHGVAGHSGYPWLGKSATELLMRAMVDAVDADFGSSDLFGNTTTNVGTLSGGVAANVIADLATAAIAVRVAIGPEVGGSDVVKGRLVDVLNSVDAEAFDIECRPGYGAIELACDVQDFETVTVNYGTDIPYLKGNHTRYLYGPGSILVSHGVNEALTLGDLETAVEDYKKLIIHAIQS